MAIDRHELEEVAELLRSATRAVAFCGAGVSAESGIATFRDPGGLWERFDPYEVGTVEGLTEVLAEHPERVRDFLREVVSALDAARPNPGHLALGELERRGILQCVITQNVDNLHAEAGNRRVVELHGNLYRARCLECGRRVQFSKQEVLGRARKLLWAERFSLQDLLAGWLRCACGGITRPDVVLFGEAVQDFPQAMSQALQADVLLILGSSLTVHPAALIPEQAARAGIPLVEINPTPSALSSLTAFSLRAKGGEALPQILERL